jgi:biotin transport system ATP-binding protein
MPTSGSIRFRDRPLEEDLTLVRQKVGFVFQNPLHQCIGQTVWDDVAFGPHNLGLAPEEIDQRVRDALAGVGFSTAELSELYQLHPALLSGGQQRKLAIAGVLAMYPQLIILDEPLAGLDYPGVKEILSQIIRLHQEGHTILIITHDVEKMLAHATRLTIMDEGSIVADDAPPKVYHLLEDHGVRCREASKIAEMTWIH